MTKILFEILLSCFVFAYLLYFYLIIIEESWEWKKGLTISILMAIFQTFIEQYEFYLNNMFIIDSINIILFLLFYMRRVNMLTIISSLFIDLIYSVLVPLTAFSASFIIDIELTREFNIYRIIFNIVLHSLIIITLYFITEPLVKIKKYVNKNTFYIICISIILVNEGFDYIYKGFIENEDISIFIIYIFVVSLILYYIVMKYCIIMKENFDTQIMNKTNSLTVEYVKSLEKEHEQVKKIKHDLQNKLRVLYELQKEKKYKQVETILGNSIQDIKNNITSISGNIYIDAIFRQKMSQYSQINFHTDILLSKDFYLDENDLISLLSNIIDNGCEELLRIRKNDFYIKIKGDSCQLLINQQNACGIKRNLTTKKDKKYHGYGMKIIDDIIDKYEGTKDINISDVFVCKITLFLS